jgi:uncharacterized protein
VTIQPGEGREFLGVGLAFPLGLDASGQMLLTQLEQHVRQSIELIMETVPGERVMRPDFGAGLHDLVFEPVNVGTIALVQHEVQEALINYEPRIDVLSVSVTADQGTAGLLLINLSYRIRSTDTMFNLVYPFYLARSG